MCNNSFAYIAIAILASLIFFIQGESEIFPPTTGGAAKMAEDSQIQFLGKLPLDPIIGL